MLSAQKTADYGTLAGLIDRAGENIASAIQTASAKTGVDFSYLLQQAGVESSFKAEAKASSSSATGLYQFIESTWLGMVNKYGDKYGLGDYAAKINDTGKVADKAMRKEILDLRKDPHICALMAGELAAENKSILQNCTSRDIGSTELYMAHFMGPSGAAKFLNTLGKSPNANAANLFPAAAAANKNIFYTAAGKPRSVQDVYALFDKKFEIASTSCDATTATNTTTVKSPSPTTAESADMIKVSTQISSGKKTGKTAGIIGQHPMAHAVQRAPAKSFDITQNHGGIPGLQNLAILPVDMLELMKTESHSDNSRYNS